MSTIASLGASDNGANSRTTINTNFTNLNTDKIETSVLDTDTTLAANSDSKIATQKAVKAYADALLSVFTSSKAGVSAGPSSASTQTITHTLGRTPVVIRLHALGAFSSSVNARVYSTSMGSWNATGNRCVYIGSGAGALDSDTSTTFAIYISDDGVNVCSGVVQNVTSTTFDIVWSFSVGSTVASLGFHWEAN